MLVCALGIQAVSTWKVYDMCREPLIYPGYAGLFIYRHPGKIAHFLVQARQGIEQGTFSAIGVTNKSNGI